MSSPRTSLRVLEVCQWLHQRGFLAAADGNVSIREGDRIVITPSGRHKGFLEQRDLAEVTLDGQVLSGKPSSERLMHLEVYRRCPKAKAVVHAHPPHAIAWTIAHPNMRELPGECISEVILAAGRIPIIPYARPGTADMGHVLAGEVEEHRMLILSRHGALSWGEDLDEAYWGMERLEHSALVLAQAMALGGLTSLPPEEVAHLRELRKKLGSRTL